MIPITLKLRNFLSYGEQVELLDFTTFKLACLSGRNGHGKSALLDAMTWAVWGEARKAGYSRTPDADLLRLNAEEMSVEFTFRLGRHEYCILREFKKGRRSGKLDIWGRETSAEQYSVLTGSSKRETQKRIIDLVGLDYRTFINSSFLQQGKADEFTRQSPQDRKEILGNILGLHYYDRLLEETKQRWSTLRAESRSLEKQIESINTELEQEPETIQEEKRLQESINSLNKSLQTIRDNQKQLNDRIASHRMIRDRINMWEEEQKNIQKQLTDIQQRQKKLVTEKNDLQNLIKRETEINKNHQRYEEISITLHALLDTETLHKELQSKKETLQRTIESQRAQYREQLASLNSELTHHQSTINDCQQVLNQRDAIGKHYAEYQQTLKEEQRLESLRPRYEDIQNQIQQTEAQIQKERQHITEQIAERRGSLKDIPAIEKDIHQKKQQLKTRPQIEEQLQNQKQQLESLTERGQEISGSLERQRDQKQRCEKTITDTEEKLSLLQKGDTTHCPLCHAELDGNRQQQMETQFQNEIQTARQQIKSLNTQIKKDEKERDNLRHQYKDLNNKIETTSKQLESLNQMQQQLTKDDEEIQRLAKLKTELNRLTTQLESGQYAQEAQNHLAQLQQSLKELEYNPTAHDTINKQLAQQRPYELQWQRLQDAEKRHQQSTQRIEELQKEIQSITQILETNNFAQHEQASLKTLEEQLHPLEKELNTRKALQNEQTQLRNAITDWNRLQHAKERLPELESEGENLTNQLNELQRRLETLQTQKAEAQPALSKLQQLENQLTTSEKDRSKKETQRDKIQYQLGGIQEKRSRLQERKNELAQIKETLTTLLRDERLYDILKTAFSRDGIPAMIVEQSLPELENDANRLLSRLSNGLCSLALESQREKKSGGMAETLDIKISDEMGTRDYEMFSGGEAFRTDLALRIALSQLLCRRAGSQLQLLIIDEGFGSQDTEGLNNIVEAINDIHDEFEKIIVVTHLEELKEKFMTRIEVTKEPGLGSHFEVIHTF